jgi:hypothetical protein
VNALWDTSIEESFRKTAAKDRISVGNAATQRHA